MLPSWRNETTLLLPLLVVWNRRKRILSKLIDTSYLEHFLVFININLVEAEVDCEIRSSRFLCEPLLERITTENKTELHMNHATKKTALWDTTPKCKLFYRYQLLLPFSDYPQITPNPQQLLQNTYLRTSFHRQWLFECFITEKTLTYSNLHNNYLDRLQIKTLWPFLTPFCWLLQYKILAIPPPYVNPRIFHKFHLLPLSLYRLY